jgi:hypothetical protein
MAHLVFVENEHGDVIDNEIYCSDQCAKNSPRYNGWNGCNEISINEPCWHCQAQVKGIEE